MKENEWGLVFNGFIDMDPIEQELIGFINYVKNDLKDDLKKVYPTMLVVAQDEEQATLFAQGVANILKKEGLISYYVNRPSFLWDKPISDNFDCVLVNDFDNKSVDKNSLDIISKRIVRSPFNDRLNMVTIFYTTKERTEQYKAFFKEDYYKLFESRITLKPYTIQNIMDGAHYYFDEWQCLGEIKLKDDFYPALEQWIDTVYGRADKKGKDFVFGLKDRLIKQSKILGEPYVFGANTIPRYWKKESSDVVQNDIEDKFSNYTCIQDILRFAQNNIGKKVGRKEYNLILKADDFFVVKQFSRDYARLLNSKNYNVIYSKIVEIINVEELIDVDEYQNKHGLILVKGLDELDENNKDSNSEIIENLLSVISDKNSDLVWIVYTENGDLGKDIQNKFASFEFIEKIASTIETDKQEYTIEDSIRMNCVSQREEFSHEIYVVLDNKEEKIASIDAGSKTFEYIFKIPEEWMKDKNEGFVSFKLNTYYGDEFIGSSYTKDIKIVVPESYKPMIEILSITDENGVGLEKAKLVENKSQLCFKINVSEPNGTKIKGIMTSFDGEIYTGEEFTTGVLKNHGVLKYSIQAIDSRECITVLEGSVNVEEEFKRNPDFDAVLKKEEELKNLVKSVKGNSGEINVLLLSMSYLAGVRFSDYFYSIQKKYGSDERKFEGKYISQQEPIPKMLAEMLADQDEKLDYIYVFNTYAVVNPEEAMKYNLKFTGSDKTYTTFEYFKERIGGLVEDESRIVGVMLENEEEKVNISKALNEFTKSLITHSENAKVNLYVDINGGQREFGVVVDSILTLIKNIDNVELKGIYTPGYSPKTHKSSIKLLDDVFYVYDFVGGMHEFLSFGRSNGLVRFNESVENENENGLVDAINNISNSISLNRMDNFSANLKELAKTLDENKDLKGYYGTVKDLVLNNYKVNISNKMYDLLGENSDYLPAQLQWCLDKNLLQQALVLVETKTACQLKNSGIIEVEAWRKAECPDEDENKLCINQFVTFINKSLFSNREDWKNYKGQDISSNDLFSVYFKQMNQQQTQIFTNEEKVIKNIRKHKNKKVNPEKYYCYYGNPKNWRDKNKWHGIEEKNKALRNKILGSNYSKYDKIEYNGSPYIEQDLFVREKLRNDPDFLERFYRVCYVYKVLKLIRNDTVHSLGKYTNTSEDVANWVRFYLEQLEQLIQTAKKIHGN
ncbi:hypothetical protein DXD51_05380 [Eubacterium sp. TM05-53]|nr:hypothetical protein DXD51_05380 [Eubacterium sp. TM05-53]